MYKSVLSKMSTKDREILESLYNLVLQKLDEYSENRKIINHINDKINKTINYPPKIWSKRRSIRVFLLNTKKQYDITLITNIYHLMDRTGDSILKNIDKINKEYQVENAQNKINKSILKKLHLLRDKLIAHHDVNYKNNKWTDWLNYLDLDKLVKQTKQYYQEVFDTITKPDTSRMLSVSYIWKHWSTAEICKKWIDQIAHFKDI